MSLASSKIHISRLRAKNELFISSNQCCQVQNEGKTMADEKIEFLSAVLVINVVKFKKRGRLW